MTNKPTVRPTLVLVSGVLALSGCATVQREARLPEVREAVGQRIGQNIAWNQNSEEDREVGDAVRRLVRQELTVEAAVQVGASTAVCSPASTHSWRAWATGFASASATCRCGTTRFTSTAPPSR
jgi:hypothetical protein